jgi:hypothetical protein
MDILWSSILTMLLASWSILCLNIPAETDSWCHRLFRKCLWILMTIVGPEVVCQRALGEWLVAKRWTKEFEESGYKKWTMMHSFYANMGGIFLASNDEEHFPINAAQIHFLVRNRYIKFPSVTKDEIKDKNKTNGLLRLIILGQTFWFVLNWFARLYQHVPFTTLGISTLAFITPALGTLYFWWHKPMDIEHHIIVSLKPHITIAQIRELEGQYDIAWVRTPLEFVKREKEWAWNKYWYAGSAFWKNC